MARISREHTHHGQGVNILEEKPYVDPHSGLIGRYTHKYFMIGKRLPSFIRVMIPTSVLRIEERSWNAYPLTRSVYTIPIFGNRFCMDLRTVYVTQTRGGRARRLCSLLLAAALHGLLFSCTM